MITVVYPPGASDPIHRHKRPCVFFTCWKASVAMQLKGGKEVTLHARPDILRRSERHSYRWPEIPATLNQRSSLCFLVKDKGAPVLVPVDPTAAGVFCFAKIR